MTGHAPDGIAPLVGYRFFRVDHSQTLGSLRERVSWSPRGPTRAQCRIAPFIDATHAAPMEDCTCGLYAMKRLSDVGLAVVAWRPYLAARVELWGKVVVTERGYRAEMGRIAELIPSPLQEQIALAAARVYDVPVSRQLWEQWLVGGPLDDQPVPSMAVMVGPGRLEIPACGQLVIRLDLFPRRLPRVPPKPVRKRRTSSASAALQWLPTALRALGNGVTLPLAVLPQRPSRPGRLNAAAQLLPVVSWAGRFPELHL